MSVELPEAMILAEQMKKVLIGKEFESYHLQNYERMQKIGFLNKNILDFDQLLNGKIIDIKSRGNVILVDLDNNMNLLIVPEYGGEVFYYEEDKAITKKYHIKITFHDNTILTVRIKSMGCILALTSEGLSNSYLYKRDFLNGISPIEDDFTFESFSKDLSLCNRNLKSILVGKEALLVGLSNSAFQDIIYRAKLSPKKKGSDLTEFETDALYNAIKALIKERIEFRGKYQFIDLYGKKGKYNPLMGPNMKGKSCSECGSEIEKMSFGGGQIYLCPICQES